MAEIFFSYKTEDRKRIRPLIVALREAGLDVWWDQDMADGAPWRETIVEQLESSTLCIVAWSKLSVSAAGRYVREEAERAIARDAYLGVLIDEVRPPFGFGEQQAIKLAAWKGRKSDPLLASFVERVRARLEHRPAAPGRPAKRRLPFAPRQIALGAAVAAALAAAGALFWIYARSSAPAPVAPETPTAFVNARLGREACSWLQISSVTEATGGERIALTGIAPAREGVQERLLGDALAAGVPVVEIGVDDIALGPPETCASLQFLRQYAWGGRPRLSVRDPRGEFARTPQGLTIPFQFSLDYRELPRYAALLGLDSIHGVSDEIEDLHSYRRDTRPDRLQGEVATYTILMDDEGRAARNIGLVLMTSTAPIRKALIERVGRGGDRATLAELRQTAARDHWQFELALVRCGFENGPSGSHPC